jgi:selenide,water dikinase
MGGRPLTALALVCFPEKGDLEILGQILAGGLSKMMEAGCTVIGGHSIRDEETKFGYSITGLIHPKRVLANSGARPGDALVLTKAIGTGVIATAIKKEKAQDSWIRVAVESMTTLNKKAADVLAAAYEAHGMTDITGFGLIGHVRELALASEVTMRLYADRVPVLPGALECVRAGYLPGGLKANRDFAECVVEYDGNIAEDLKALLYDPQTAGGLLVSLAADQADRLVSELRDAGLPAARVGDVEEFERPLIRVS